MRMSRRRMIWLIITSLVLGLWLVLTFELIPSYTYENSDRAMAWIETPSKGSTLEQVELAYSIYEAQNPDVRLMRTRQLPWWSPWNWHDIFTHRRWKYDYMVPSNPPNYNEVQIQE